MTVRFKLQCKDCMWWQGQLGSHNHDGECHGAPPLIEKNNLHRAAYPITQGSDTGCAMWCDGEDPPTQVVTGKRAMDVGT